ncbi:PREDICTED: epsin-1 isoform X5 [Nanorana parkeri]|uniref:epsin-1 isoform X5 n=1 Tax=Nanorana parkeri TaxID=125878 RepID=UPI0008547A51|nr:PREDICTED: epsin-1 isoform X5 [Nanorana parkeri]
MSTSSLRRQMKNIVHNYSEAEIKVREATSNDPWGPSSSLMSEIADLTYNVVAFSEIMSMIWKRLNDHGKNWRHVYKAMTLMEYLIKTGSERVAQQCKENIYAIQTLKDFQYVDRDGKDQGVNVREKAKQLVSLLKDDERLKEERAHALKTKEKLAQTSTSSSASTMNPAPEAEQAWPQSSGEEELQLQLALAMSKEEAEQVRAKEERIKRGDDLRLQMAIEESRKEAPTKQEESSLMDLADVFNSPPAAVAASDPWGATAAPPSDPWAGAVPTSAVPAVSDPWGGPPVATGASTDPWGAGVQAGSTASDPWTGKAAVSSIEAKSVSDPWNPGGSTATGGVQSKDPWSSSPSIAAKQATDPWAPAATFSDPWGGSPSKPSTNGTIASTTFDQFITSADEFSDFDNLRTTLPQSGSSTGELDLLAGEVPMSRSLGSRSPDAFDMAAMSSSFSENSKTTRKTPESFLGPNAALVDLDSLISKPTIQNIKTSNPFLVTGAPSSTTTNPFQTNQQSSLTLNQLRSSPVMSMGQPVTPAGQAPAAIPYSSVSPMVSVSPLAPGIPLANVSPVIGMSGLPVAVVPPGVPPMSLPAMMPPQQMVAQPMVPNLSTQAVTSATNPFLL